MGEFLHLVWILLLRPALMLGAWVIAIVLVLSLLFFVLRKLYKGVCKIKSMSSGKTTEFNPHAVLDISPTATIHEIEAAYERQYKRLRPNEENWDKVKGQVKEIEKAYKILKNDCNRIICN